MHHKDCKQKLIELSAILYEKGYSTYKISNIVGYHPSTIHRWLKMYCDITPRNREEARDLTKKILVCQYCGKSFRPNDIGSRKNRKTCSKECRALYMSEMFSFDSNPFWKGGTCNHTTKKIAVEIYGIEKVCSSCGSKERVNIHHKNRDHTDNSKENLVFLCSKCHSEEHYHNGDFKGLKNYSP